MICEICGIEKEPYHRQKYHHSWGHKISNTVMGHIVTIETRNLISKNCKGKSTGKRNGNFNKNRIVIKEGYLFNLDKNEFVHKLVLEKKLGRKLEKDEISHHKNENKLDNKENNLDVTTRDKHAKIHSINKKRDKNMRWI